VCPHVRAYVCPPNKFSAYTKIFVTLFMSIMTLEPSIIKLMTLDLIVMKGRGYVGSVPTFINISWVVLQKKHAASVTEINFRLPEVCKQKYNVFSFVTNLTVLRNMCWELFKQERMFVLQQNIHQTHRLRMFFYFFIFIIDTGLFVSVVVSIFCWNFVEEMRTKILIV